LGVRADAESLRLIPIFRNCEAVPLQVLAFAAERQNFAAGEFLIKEGTRAKSAYFVLNGTVDVEQGRRRLGTAEPGALLGELAMIGNANYSLSAVAAESVATARIDNALFRRVAEEYPEFGAAVLQAISEKLGASVRELDQVRDMLVKARNFSELE
jgi:CRP/FNR family transcriptional regulator, cyclic AMP receptor protein